jgi:hypothetical protein
MPVSETLESRLEHLGNYLGRIIYWFGKQEKVHDINRMLNLKGPIYFALSQNDPTCIIETLTFSSFSGRTALRVYECGRGGGGDKGSGAEAFVRPINITAFQLSWTWPLDLV